MNIFSKDGNTSQKMRKGTNTYITRSGKTEKNKNNKIIPN